MTHARLQGLQVDYNQIAVSQFKPRQTDFDIVYDSGVDGIRAAAAGCHAAAGLEPDLRSVIPVDGKALTSVVENKRSPIAVHFRPNEHQTVGNQLHRNV